MAPSSGLEWSVWISITCTGVTITELNSTLTSFCSHCNRLNYDYNCIRNRNRLRASINDKNASICIYNVQTSTHYEQCTHCDQIHYCFSFIHYK